MAFLYETDPRRMIEAFVVRADLDTINCIDDRASDANPSGIQLPGAVASVVDAVKYFKDVQEDHAWEIVHKAGIPIAAHGDNLHGDLGCKYNSLVASSPEVVSAVESVSAYHRIARVRQLGTVATYYGPHHPTHAVINHRKGLSVNPNEAAKAGLGIFNFDRWAAEEIGKKLMINPKRFATHMEHVYRATVRAASGITNFITL